MEPGEVVDADVAGVGGVAKSFRSKQGRRINTALERRTNHFWGVWHRSKKVWQRNKKVTNRKTVKLRLFRF